MKKFVCTLACFIAFGVWLSATPAHAGFLGASATLDQLTPGMSIGVEGFTFTDFELTPSAAANNKPIAPEDFSVTAIPLPDNKVDLLFQFFPGTWKEGEYTEMVLAFTALAPDGTAFMHHGLSFGPSFLGDLSGDPFALINEMVAPMDPQSTQAPYTLAVFRDPVFSQLIDSKPIETPANKLRISKDIQIFGGAGSEPTRVLLTDFRQTFMGTPRIPEPTTAALAGLCLVGVGVRRRRG